MRLPAAISLLALLLFFGCGGPDDGGAGEIETDGDDGELLILGAASLTTALTEYAEEFEAASGVRVRTSFAGSDQLATQIRQGAVADVFASADTDLPERLHSEGLVGKPRIFASNRLVVAIPADSSISSLAEIARPGLDLVIGDESVPVGAYTHHLLNQLPATERASILYNVRSEEPDVGSMIAKLIQEVADAAVVYATDVAAAGNRLRPIAIADRFQPEIAYAAAVVSNSDSPDLAAEFIDGLIEGKGADALDREGFLPPP